MMIIMTATTAIWRQQRQPRQRQPKQRQPQQRDNHNKKKLKKMVLVQCYWSHNLKG